MRILHPNGQLHLLPPQSLNSLQASCPPAQNQARGQEDAVARALYLLLDQVKDLLHASTHNLSQIAAGDRPPPLAAEGNDFNALFLEGLGQSMAILLLNLLGGGKGRAQHHSDVIGQMVASHRKNHGMTDSVFNEDANAGRAGPNVHYSDTHLPFRISEHRLGRGQGLHDNLRHLHMRLLHTLHQVADSRGGAGHHMDIHFQPEAIQPQWVANPLLAIQSVGTGDHMDDLAIVGQGNSPCRLQDAVDVRPGHAPAAAGYSRHSLTVERRDMLPPHTHQGPFHSVARYPLCPLHRLQDRS